MRGTTHEKSPGPAAYMPNLGSEQSQSENLNQELSSFSGVSSKSRGTTRSCTFGVQTRKVASSQGVPYISAEHSRSVPTRGCSKQNKRVVRRITNQWMDDVLLYIYIFLYYYLKKLASWPTARAEKTSESTLQAPGNTTFRKERASKSRSAMRLWRRSERPSER